MSLYTRSQFGATVINDFAHRRNRNEVLEKSVQHSASAALETRALGHPDFEGLDIGERRTARMVSVFLDLTNFTGRTFWDDQDEVVDLAHAVLSGFIEVVSLFGGHPLGLRGDGLYAGFSPGDPSFTASMALSACAFALDGVENEVNPWLDRRGIAHVQARAGLDYGPTTFVRSGSHDRSEINPLGFAANFAAKCEKQADSWEIVVGDQLHELLPDYPFFVEHEDSPKRYTRDDKTESYKFYDYRWRNTVKHLPGVIERLGGTPTSRIHSR
ncbi:class 3 adenylate cyclase [Kribbella steppae]|uniref:Class 3 adenylate cyclase n=1 Tax=Kribbella steppae TaxID=2512223 RepID=A0A4R2H0X5_9ACTN|nr:adenylate/guanylate cyclase domain-containing protein [Kribbella steppae]TCO18130.1 class 3 adenylate cyclase [Kribbella steppae]